MDNNNDNKKKGKKILILLILLLLLLILGFFFWMFYMQKGNSSAVPVTPGQSNPATTTPGYDAVASTSNPIVTPVQGIWQPIDPDLSLCWDAATSGCVQDPSRHNDLIDLNGDGSVYLGALEYCQYLDANGTTTDKTAQNIWRLPTIDELMTAASTTPADFQDGDYWSISSSTSDREWLLGLSQKVNFFQTDVGKLNGEDLRCIR